MPQPAKSDHPWHARARFRSPALAAASGLCLVLAFPPYDLWPAAPIGVALLTLACRSLRPSGGLATGFVAGMAFFAPLLQWSGTYVGPVPWLLLAVSQAFFFALLGGGVVLAQRWVPRAALPPVVACLWVLQEALRDRLPWGGFPWGRLGFSSADAPWVPAVAWGGVPLLAWLIALSGGLLAAAATQLRRDTRAAGLSIATAALVMAAPTLLPALPTTAPEADRSAVVAVVQGNVPRLGLDFNAQREAVLRNHVARTRELADAVAAGRTPRPDLVVWPENGSDIDPFTDASVYAFIDEVVKQVGVPTLVGAVLNGPDEYISNTGILWDPVSGPGPRYVKRHPVPFAEYIPLRSVARKVSSAVDLVARDFAAGDRVGVFPFPGGGDFGDVICFEIGYDDLVRDVVVGGASLVSVQTNNATFGRTPQTEQQLVMSRVRAVEHRRTVLVAATSGVSAVIGPDGDVRARAELFTPAVLVVEVPLTTRRTPATRGGSAGEAFLAIVGVLAIAIPILRGRSTRMVIRKSRRQSALTRATPPTVEHPRGRART